MSSNENQLYHKAIPRRHPWNESKPMESEAEMREEVTHLQLLASMTTDATALMEIQTLIGELQRRIRERGNGHVPRLWPPTSRLS
jgi:hypothetical protein